LFSSQITSAKEKTIVNKLYKKLFEKCLDFHLLKRNVEHLLNSGLIPDLQDKQFINILVNWVSSCEPVIDDSLEADVLSSFFDVYHRKAGTIHPDFVFELLNSGAITFDLFKYYVDHGGDVMKKDKTGNDLLHVLFQYAALSSTPELKNYPKILDVLINKLPLSNQTDLHNYQPLDTLISPLSTLFKTGFRDEIITTTFKALIKKGAVLKIETLLTLLQRGIWEADFICKCKDIKGSLFVTFANGILFDHLMSRISSPSNFKSSVHQEKFADMVLAFLGTRANEKDKKTKRTPLSHYLLQICKEKNDTIESALTSFVAYLEKCTPTYTEYSLSQLETEFKFFVSLTSRVVRTKKIDCILERFGKGMKRLRQKYIVLMIIAGNRFFSRSAIFQIEQYLGEDFDQFSGSYC